MRAHLHALVAMALVAGTAACQTAPPAPDPKPALQAPAEVAARVYFDKAAAWLPADVIAVTVLDTRRFKRALSLVEWRSSDPKLRAAMRARQDRLLQDLSALFRARMGVDPFDAEHVVLGFHKAGVEVLFFGVKAAEMATRKTEEGRKLVRLFPNAEPDKAVMRGQELWAQLTPDGLAVHVPFTGGPPGTPRHTTRLQGTERAALFHKVLETSPSTFAIAAVFDDPQLTSLANAQTGVPAPRAARLSLDDDLTLLIEGEPETLKKAQELFDEGIAMAEKELDALLAPRAQTETSTPELLGRLQIASLRKVLSVGLRTETQGDTWRVSMPTVDYDVALGLSYSGTMAAIAIPAFLRSVKKSKTAEAEQYTRRITDAAVAYYETDRLDKNGKPLPCAFPPSAPMSGPTPSDGATAMPKADPKLWAPYMVTFDAPTYFAYEATSNGMTGKDAILTVRAHADFDSSSPRQHRTEILVEGQGRVDGACKAIVRAPITHNEFE